MAECNDGETPQRDGRKGEKGIGGGGLDLGAVKPARGLMELATAGWLVDRYFLLSSPLVSSRRSLALTY